MAVKPWIGQIKEPTNYKPIRNAEKAPNITLTLEYAYGYRAKDCRNNIRYLPSGEIIYHCAAVGV
jgi:hypothetical protein